MEPQSVLFGMINKLYIFASCFNHAKQILMLWRKEIDFVARKAGEIVYIQSTYLLADETTRLREFGNLQAIRNNYPKYVVSLDEWTNSSTVNGIKHLHLGDFLKQDIF